MADMVIIGGVRYRREDAERLGLLVEEKKATPKNKARKPGNKASESDEKGS